MQSANTDPPREKPGSFGLLFPWLLLCSTAVLGCATPLERDSPAPRDAIFNRAPGSNADNTAFIVLGDEAIIITSPDGLMWLPADAGVAEETGWQAHLP